jgi:hypothetical protein
VQKNLSNGYQLHGVAIKVKGSMSTRRRHVHMQYPKTTWWSDAEIDLLFSFLLQDGRYDESVSIISLSMVQTIQGAQLVFVTYIEAIRYRKKLREAHKDWDDAKIDINIVTL